MELSPRALVRLVQNPRPDCRGSELWVEQWSGVTLHAERGRVVHHEARGGVSVRARVWTADGRLGEAAGDALEQAEVLLSRAAEAAPLGAPNPYAGPVGPTAARGRGLGIDDRRYAGLSDEDRAEVVVQIDREARADRRVMPGDAVYEDARAQRVLVNSRALALEEWSTTFRCRVQGAVATPDREIALLERVDGRSFASVASFPIGQSLTDRASLLCAPAGATPSGPVRVVLPARVTAALFERIATVFSWADPSRSFLGRGPLHRKLHVIDDGGHPGGLRSRAFDDRGVPPTAVVLVREGVLDGRLIDVESARAADVGPSGHAWGGGLAVSNLLLRQGTRSVVALLSERAETPALVIDHFEDLGTSLDLGSGMMRVVAAGSWRRATRLEGSVRRVVLEADLGDALRRLVDISSDTDRIGSIDAPALVLDGFVAVG